MLRLILSLLAGRHMHPPRRHQSCCHPHAIAILAVPRYRGHSSLPYHSPVCHERLLAQVQNLKDGVARFGAGHWSNILQAYSFASHRTGVHLKDKWRNLQKSGEV